jgi:hydrogenase-4 component H
MAIEWITNMSILSKIREAWVGIHTGRVTLPYPAQPRPVAANFRGRPIFDAAKCIGCGGCASNCPAREILVLDVCQEIRILKYLGRRCTFCGRCADLCPEKAITMSNEYETATPAIADLQQTLELFMSTCQRCGRCFPAHPARETQTLRLSLRRPRPRTLGLQIQILPRGRTARR